MQHALNYKTMIAEQLFTGLPPSLYFDLAFIGAFLGYLSTLLFIWFGWQYRHDPDGAMARYVKSQGYGPTFKWYWVDGWKQTHFRLSVMYKLLFPTVTYGLMHKAGNPYLAFVIPGMALLVFMALAVVAHE